MSARIFIADFLKNHQVANWDRYIEQLSYGPAEELELFETNARGVLRVNKIRHSRPSAAPTIGRAELIEKLETLDPETLLTPRAFFTPQGGLHLYTDKQDNFIGMLVLWPENWTKP